MDTVDVFLAISSANSYARANVSCGLESTSENKSRRSVCSAGNVEPVVVRCRAREYPISRGRKKDETASMTRPRREKTNPIFEETVARRIVVGRVMVMPIPTADPLIAAIVGLRHL